MKVTNNIRAVILGIFILIGLAIFILTILTLGSQKKTFDRSITIKSYFDNVNGLQKGNNIWFSGVKVGTIRKVTLTGKGKVEVDMNIDEQSRQFIRKDAKARISSDGLIGNKIIEIYGGTLQSEEIEPGDLLGNQKLISTDEMMNTLSKNNDNLLAITNDFKIIGNRIVQGKGSIGKLLTDETLINQINATTLTLKRASMNLEKISADVSAYTSKLNKKGSLANDLVTDTIIFNKLRSTVSQLQEVASKSKEVINNLNTAGNSINNGLNNKNVPIGMLLNDENSATNIKVILQNLQSSSKKLDEDLEAIQHNFLLRRFFRKKAKNEPTVTDTTTN
ncbi:MAG: MlaD family protein [Bacteroidota bacterium]|jgi:phospholipid/cholesterol/gamma-HCH transport system substrate-binding protein|nr:MlaD family protein [Bacteroidota bacterium]